LHLSSLGRKTHKRLGCIRESVQCEKRGITDCEEKGQWAKVTWSRERCEWWGSGGPPGGAELSTWGPKDLSEGMAVLYSKTRAD